MSTVDVFVRLGRDEDTRTLSFKIPGNIPAKEIVNAGMAIDGNSVVAGIGYEEDVQYKGYTHPVFQIAATLPSVGNRCPAYHATLPQALSCFQSRLVAWLEYHEHEVEFS